MTGEYKLLRDDLIALIARHKIGECMATSDSMIADYLMTCMEVISSALWAKKYHPRKPEKVQLKQTEKRKERP